MPSLRKLLGIVWILSSSICGVVCAQDRGNNTFSSAALHENVISFVRWDVSGGNLLCVFSKKDDNGPHGKATLPTRSMTIYRQDGAKYQQIFEFETPDWLLNAFPLGELDGRFFVGWGGGSSYHFRVFAYLQGTVEKVLDVGSRGMPEIVFDADGRESILVTEMELVAGQYGRSAGKTEIYRWNGVHYDNIGVLPWGKRFLHLCKAPDFP